MSYPEVSRQARRGGRLVVRKPEVDRVSSQGVRGAVSNGERSDRGRVEAAGEHQPNGDVADEGGTHRTVDPSEKFVLEHFAGRQCRRREHVPVFEYFETSVSKP